jgi:YNFM family putative membrane transporter
MAEALYAQMFPASAPARQSGAALFRNFVIGLAAFLTVVDLFATQAILPSLARAYR